MMRDNSPYDARTIEGIKRGFSWCRKCGNTWNWVDPFTIPTRPDGGTFPICKPCGSKMTVELVLSHLKLFLDKEERLDEELEYARPWVKLWGTERQGDEDPYAVKKRHESTQR